MKQNLTEAREQIVALEEKGITLFLSDGKLKYRVQNGTLSPEDKETITAAKEDLVAALEAEKELVLTHAPQGEPLPFTNVQAAYLTGRTSAVEWGQVGCQGYVEVNFGSFEPEDIIRAWHKMVDRHEMLRSKVRAEGIETFPSIEQMPETPVIDLLSVNDTEVERKLSQVRDHFTDVKYDLEQLPLFQTAVTKRREGNYFHLSIDLITVDFASVQILIDEMGKVLQGEPLPVSTLTYADFARFHRKQKDSIKWVRDRTYWMQRIEEIPSAPRLPQDGRAKAEEEGEEKKFRRIQEFLSLSHWNGLKQSAQMYGITPSAAVMAVYGAVLAKWSENQKFTLNLPIQSRPEEEGEAAFLVGDFTSVNLLEVDFQTKMNFIDHARAVAKQLYLDLEHKTFSGVDVMREISKARGKEEAFMPYVFTGILKAKSTVGVIDNGLSQTPQVWVDCQVVDLSDLALEERGLMISWDVRKGALKASIVNDMYRAFVDTLQMLAEDPALWEQPLAVKMPVCSSFADLAVIDCKKKDIPLYEGLLRHAADTPEHIAIIDRAGSRTYKELLEDVRRVAGFLKGRVGAGESKIIAIDMKKSAKQIAAAIGAMLAGFAYLPVDVKQPDIRKNRILHLAKPDYVFRDDNIEEALGCKDVYESRSIHELAYLIYTSGSTGEPKGVKISHSAAYNTIVDMNERFQVGADEKVLGIAELSFDLSVYDIFGTFHAGATLVLTDPDRRSDPSHWAELIDRYGITLWNSVPAQAEMLLSYAEGLYLFDTVKQVWMSGDWIRTGLPNELKKLMPNVAVTSLGGATEGGIWSIYHRIGAEEEHPSVLYGAALGNQWMSVVDDELQICPVYAPGEIVIGGASLADGYLHDEKLTKEKFVYLEQIHQYLYRTGDKGRFVENGEIEFLGRLDNQVKVNGHRIELAEIESALLEIPEVRKCCVVHYRDMGKENLAAFVVEEGYADVDTICKNVELPPAALTAEEIERFNQLLDQSICESVYLTFAGQLENPAAGISRETLGKLLGVQERYEGLLEKWLHILEDQGLVQAEGDWYRFTAGMTESSWKQFEKPELLKVAPIEVSTYIKQHAENSKALFRGELNPLVFLFPEGSTAIAEKLYGETAIAKYLNDIISQITARYAEAKKKISILEVGGGIGATTERILEVLPAHTYQYTFSDLSPFFLNHMKSKHPQVETCIVDLDQLEECQTLERYDVIVAAGVLNNTVNIPKTVAQLAEHLTENGVLMITEPVGEHMEINVSQAFMMPVHTDARADENRCFLQKEEWKDTIEAAGLRLAERFPHPDVSYDLFGQNLFVAVREPKRTQTDYTKFLQERLTAAMIPTVIQKISQMPLTANGKIDRKQLTELAKQQRMEEKQTEVAEVQMPSVNSRLEDQICGILKEISGRDQILAEEDLLQIGFDSLLLSQAAGRIVKEIPEAKKFRFDEILRVALSEATIRSIAQYIVPASEEKTEMGKEPLPNGTEEGIQKEPSEGSAAESRQERKVDLYVDKESTAFLQDILIQLDRRQILYQVMNLGEIQQALQAHPDRKIVLMGYGSYVAGLVELASELLTQGTMLEKMILVNPTAAEEHLLFLGDVLISEAEKEVMTSWEQAVIGDVDICERNGIAQRIVEEW